MKRCPQCYEVYEESERFCEADGHELLADPALTPKSRSVPPPAPPVASSIWLPAATIGILIGVGIGAAIFAAITFSSRSNSDEPRIVRESPDVRERTSSSNRVATVATTAPTPEPEESPSPEAEEEAVAEASPAVNEVNKTTTVAHLNQGPISTGQKTKAADAETGVQTVIEMTDGSTLDVDAAWEDKQGVWYRRSGLVSFVESSRVKAITERKGVTKTPEIQDR